MLRCFILVSLLFFLGYICSTAIVTKEIISASTPLDIAADPMDAAKFYIAFSNGSISIFHDFSMVPVNTVHPSFPGPSVKYDTMVIMPNSVKVIGVIATYSDISAKTGYQEAAIVSATFLRDFSRQTCVTGPQLLENPFRAPKYDIDSATGNFFFTGVTNSPIVLVHGHARGQSYCRVRYYGPVLNKASVQEVSGLIIDDLKRILYLGISKGTPNVVSLDEATNAVIGSFNFPTNSLIPANAIDLMAVASVPCLLYVASSKSPALFIIDITNPSNMALVSTITYDSKYLPVSIAISKSGDFAFVALQNIEDNTSNLLAIYLHTKSYSSIPLNDIVPVKLTHSLADSSLYVLGIDPSNMLQYKLKKITFDFE